MHEPVQLVKYAHQGHEHPVYILDRVARPGQPQMDAPQIADEPVIDQFVHQMD